jgi:hypothetical protein
MSKKTTKKSVAPVAPVAPVVERPIIEVESFVVTPSEVVAPTGPVEKLSAPVIIPATVMPGEYPTRDFVWDEPVTTALLRNQFGHEIPIERGGRWGVFANDGLMVGSYAKQEHVLPNADLVAYFEGALSALGLTWERTITLLQGGSEFVARYVIRSATVKGPDGKPLCIRFDIQNSYNGSRKVEMAIALLRLICFNGMVGMGTVQAIAQRHRSTLNAKALADKIAPQLEQAVKGYGAQLEKLISIPVTDEQGRFILRNLSRNVYRRDEPSLNFSPLTARRIETKYWDAPAEDEKDSRLTLYGVLNAGTRYFRDLENGGMVIPVGVSGATKVLPPAIEKAERQNRFFGMALAKIAEKPDDAKALPHFTAPITWNEAYGRNEGGEGEA